MHHFVNYTVDIYTQQLECAFHLISGFDQAGYRLQVLQSGHVVLEQTITVLNLKQGQRAVAKCVKRHFR